MGDKITKELTFEELMLISCGHSAFQLLWAGVQLGIFKLLSHEINVTKVEIRKHTKLQVRPLEILLDGLLTLKLIRRKNEKYINSKMAEKYLTYSKKNNLADILGWQNYIVYPGQIDFLDSLKKNTNVGLRHFPGKGNTIYERLSCNTKLEKVFQDSMSALSSTANLLLAKSDAFKKCTHLLDIGGGDGTNAAEIIKQNNHLKVTIFDHPSVCEKTKIKITSLELKGKILVKMGDVFKEDFPHEIDGVLFAHLLTIWSVERNIALLKKAYNVLPVGGKVFVFNMMSNDNGVGPMSAALGSLYFLSIATGEGKIYRKSEIKMMLEKSGFEKIKEKALPLNHCLLIGEKTDNKE